MFYGADYTVSRASVVYDGSRRDARRIAALTISASVSRLDCAKYPFTGHVVKSLYANRPHTSMLSRSQPSRSFPSGSLSTFSRSACDWAIATFKMDDEPRDEVEADMSASDWASPFVAELPKPP